MSKWISSFLFILFGLGLILSGVFINNNQNNPSPFLLFVYFTISFFLVLAGIIFVFMSILIAGDGLLWDLPMEDEGK